MDGVKSMGQRAESKEMRGGKNVENIKVGFSPNSERDELQNFPFFSFLNNLIFINLP